jgi:hypothetical protein
VAVGWLLIAIDGHEHGDLREKMPSPLDDVEMTTGDRIKGAGIDRMVPQPTPTGRIEHHPGLSTLGKIKINIRPDPDTAACRR